MNQLEEVIEQKNDKIELLRKQLETLTSQKDGDVSDQSSEIGRLSRQQLKMEQAMKVRKEEDNMSVSGLQIMALFWNYS